MNHIFVPYNYIINFKAMIICNLTTILLDTSLYLQKMNHLHALPIKDYPQCNSCSQHKFDVLTIHIIDQTIFAKFTITIP